ncbi:MAG: sporulation transcriptional regulator SpoIIID [Clostridia bacterium]|nr:sporulation transcriptional regulator SpoIIID [Clostridia bacterium]
MKGFPEERAVKLAHYIIEHKATVRAAAREFGVSKSTCHKDVTDRLRKVNRALYEEVRPILEQNLRERHIRGGRAPREKYKGL